MIPVSHLCHYFKTKIDRHPPEQAAAHQKVSDPGGGAGRVSAQTLVAGEPPGGSHPRGPQNGPSRFPSRRGAGASPFGSERSGEPPAPHERTCRRLAEGRPSLGEHPRWGLPSAKKGCDRTLPGEGQRPDTRRWRPTIGLARGDRITDLPQISRPPGRERLSLGK